MITYGSIAAYADSWASIGKGFYKDPFWYMAGKPLSGEVDIEESYETPGYYRFKTLLGGSSEPYIYVNCANPNKVYVNPYTAVNTNGDSVTIIQLCEENGWWYINSDGQTQYLYGSIENNIATIPGNYFIRYFNDDTSGRELLSTNSNFILKLPSDGDRSLQSGIYFGITAFNHLPKFMPMQLIDGSNKKLFQQFVNSQEMDDYTYLYYSVDQAIKAILDKTYPKDLGSAAIITFTDGNDDGSLERAPDKSWTDIDYQGYISNKIKNTYIQRTKLEAFSIGLKGEDIGDYNYTLFKSNLFALASDDNKATEVNNMSEVEYTLNKIIDQLQKSWLNKKIQVKINMRGTGDKIRFTLDKTRAEMNNNPENSDLWIEGIFSREDLSLNDIVYHGFKSSSEKKVVAEQVTVAGKTKYQFTFENLRDGDGEVLKTGEINFWHKNSSTPAWQPHTEFGGDSDVKTETEYSSSVVMLVMDCSSSLGDRDFTKLKNVVNSVIERLADKKSVIEYVTIDEEDAPVEYYTLQGIRIKNPTSGIYIQRQGNNVKKIFIR